MTLGTGDGRVQQVCSNWHEARNLDRDSPPPTVPRQTKKLLEDKYLDIKS